MSSLNRSARRWAALASLSISSVSLAQLSGTVQSLSFTGPVTGNMVHFTVYLPEGYASGTADLPVIYHLHGIGGAHNGNQINSVPASFEAARSAGLIQPAIIVFPDGYQDSFWADSANSDKPAETSLVQELIPYIESNFRAQTHRGGRVIQGFSMGGFGAMKFATKFPALFSACVAYDGAMVTWQFMLTSHPTQAAEIFDSDPARFDQYSPWFWAAENAAELAAQMPIRMVVGAIMSNRTFRDHLLGLGITPEYVETGLPHSLGPILDAQGAQSWAFIEDALTPASCEADLNRDGAVTSQDFFAFLGAFFQRAPRADFNNDGAITSQDYFDFLTAFFAGC